MMWPFCSGGPCSLHSRPQSIDEEWQTAPICCSRVSRACGCERAPVYYDDAMREASTAWPDVKQPSDLPQLDSNSRGACAGDTAECAENAASPHRRLPVEGPLPAIEVPTPALPAREVPTPAVAGSEDVGETQQPRKDVFSDPSKSGAAIQQLNFEGLTSCSHNMGPCDDSKIVSPQAKALATPSDHSMGCGVPVETDESPVLDANVAPSEMQPLESLQCSPVPNDVAASNCTNNSCIVAMQTSDGHEEKPHEAVFEKYVASSHSQRDICKNESVPLRDDLDKKKEASCCPIWRFRCPMRLCSIHLRRRKRHTKLEDRTEIDIGRGARYVGQWRGEHMHGQGVLTRQNGRRYTGQFVSSQAHGHGVFSGGGMTYDGEWVQDQKHGYGVYTHIDGSTYEGQWEHDEMSGKGVETGATGIHYEGDFQRGMKHGFGIYTAAVGIRYEGQFRNDQMEGQGRYKFADGRVYDGEWHQGLMSGQGKMELPNGSSYEGSYDRNEKHGYGTLTQPDGQIYRGQWCKGRQHGSGVFIDANGTITKGKWCDGQKLLSNTNKEFEMLPVNEG